MFIYPVTINLFNLCQQSFLPFYIYYFKCWHRLNEQQLNLPLKRNNVDKGKNPYGNLLLNLCRGNDLFIVNGRIGDNKEGNLTCRNASVVDYTICSSEFLKKHCKYEYFRFFKAIFRCSFTVSC